MKKSQSKPESNKHGDSEKKKRRTWSLQHHFFIFLAFSFGAQFLFWLFLATLESILSWNTLFLSPYGYFPELKELITDNPSMLMIFLIFDKFQLTRKSTLNIEFKKKKSTEAKKIARSFSGGQFRFPVNPRENP